LLVQDDHSVLVDGRHALHAGKGALVFVGAFLGGRALKGKLDRLRIEGLAIVELDAFAQAEGVGLEVG